MELRCSLSRFLVRLSGIALVVLILVDSRNPMACVTILEGNCEQVVGSPAQTTTIAGTFDRILRVRMAIFK